MHLPRNMTLAAVDDPQPAAHANFDAACAWLVSELAKRFVCEEGPPGRAFAVGTDRKLYTLEQVADGAASLWPATLVEYVMLGYSCARYTEAEELMLSWAMARQLLHDIVSAKPQWRLVWRRKPTFDRFEPNSANAGVCILGMRLAFTGEFNAPVLRSFVADGAFLTRYDA